MEITAVISSISAPKLCDFIPGKGIRVQIGFRQFDRNDTYLYLDFFDEQIALLNDFKVNDAVTCSFGINFYEVLEGVVPFLTGYNLKHMVRK